jgi:EAL domain-containing protein (putative c-di-GMP-specific phosphodiesterase class I)
VKNIAVDRGDVAITQAIIALARNFDLTVHAEGIETQQQLDMLTQRGCDRAQGYFFSRPVPPQDLIALVGRIEAMTAATAAIAAAA